MPSIVRGTCVAAALALAAAAARADTGGIELVARAVQASGSQDGPASQALFEGIAALLPLPEGALLVLDHGWGASTGLRRVALDGTVATVPAIGWLPADAHLQALGTDAGASQVAYIQRGRGEQPPVVTVVGADGRAQVLSGRPGAPLPALPADTWPTAAARGADGAWLVLDQRAAAVHRRSAGNDALPSWRLAERIPAWGDARAMLMAADAAGGAWISDHTGRLHRLSPEGRWLATVGGASAPGRDADASAPPGQDGVDVLAATPEGGALLADRQRTRLLRLSPTGEVAAALDLCAGLPRETCSARAALAGAPGYITALAALRDGRVVLADATHLYTWDARGAPAWLAGHRQACIDRDGHLLPQAVLPCLREFWPPARVAAGDHAWPTEWSAPESPLRWVLAPGPEGTRWRFEAPAAQPPGWAGRAQRAIRDAALRSIGPVDAQGRVYQTGERDAPRGIVRRDPGTGARQVVMPAGRITYDTGRWSRGLPPELRLAQWDAHTLAIADEGSHAIHALDLRNGRLRRVAGDPAQPDVADGRGAGARIVAPAWFGNGDARSVLLIDGGSRALRRVTADGEVRTLATFDDAAGSPGACGTPPWRVRAVAPDATGRWWVAMEDGRIFVQHGARMRHVAGIASSGGTVPGPLPGRFGHIFALVPGLAGDMFVVARDAVSRVSWQPEGDAATAPSSIQGKSSSSTCAS